MIIPLHCLRFYLRVRQTEFEFGLQDTYSVFILKHQLGIRHVNIRELGSKTDQVCALIEFTFQKRRYMLNNKLQIDAIVPVL